MSNLATQNNGQVIFREGDAPQDQERLAVTQAGLLSAGITLVSVVGLGTIGVPLFSITGLGSIGLGLAGLIMVAVDHVNSTDQWEYLDGLTVSQGEILPFQQVPMIVPQESNFNAIPVAVTAIQNPVNVPVTEAVKPTFHSQVSQPIAVKPSFQSMPTTVIESFVPKLEPIDVAQMLVDELYSYAIMSPSGGGKGVLVSNALRKIRAKNPEIHIFLVDPKDDPKERGYWEGVVDTWCRCDFNSMRSQSKTEFLEGVLDKYHSIQGPKLLVFDEATNIFGHLKNCSKDLLSEVKSFLSGIASSGNSRSNYVWLVGHSGNLGDYGISGGEMSCFRKIYIAPMSNIEAIKQLGNTTFAGGKFGGDGVDYIKQVASQSEVNRAVYIGAMDSWEPMARLVNHSGYDRDTHTYSDSKSEVKFTSNKSAFTEMLSRASELAIDTDNMDLFLELGELEKSGESVKGLKRLQEICLSIA